MTTRVSVALVISALSVAAVTSQTPPAGGARSSIRLVDVAAQAGLTVMNVHGAPTRDYIIDTNGNGAAWFDYDNDNDLDALLVNGSSRDRISAGGDPMAALYRNDGNGRFTDVTAASGLNKRGWGMGVCVADYDNDGLQDVYLTAFGPNALFRNTGKGTFTDVTNAAGVGDTHWSTNCAFGDFDRDGDVDLYVANYLTFDERTVPKPGLARKLPLRVDAGDVWTSWPSW
jgi:hypothetical protein